jgi:hypothetical protein
MPVDPENTNNAEKKGGEREGRKIGFETAYTSSYVTAEDTGN